MANSTYVFDQPQLSSEDKIYAIKYEPIISKRERIMAYSGVLESGRVFLPRGASFLDEFEKEVVTFPHGKHDDQIDALSQMLDKDLGRRQGVH